MVTRDALLAGLGAACCSRRSGARQPGRFSDADMTRLRTFQLASLAGRSLQREARTTPPPPRSASCSTSSRAFPARSARHNVAGHNGSLGPRRRRRASRLRLLPRSGGRRQSTTARCPPPPASAPATRRATRRRSSTPRYSPLWQFWDGRDDSLWSQALAPPEGANEGNTSRLAIAHFLAAHYAQAVHRTSSAPSPTSRTCRASRRTAMPGDPSWDTMAAADQTTVNRIYANYGKAIDAYERRLVSASFEPSAFDRFLAGDGHAVAGRHRRRAAVHRPRRLRGVPPRAAVQRLPVPQHRRAARGGPRADDRRRAPRRRLAAPDASPFNRNGRLQRRQDRRAPSPSRRSQRRSGGARRAVQDPLAAQRQQDRPLHARRRLRQSVGRREPLQLRRRDRHLQRARRTRRSSRSC